MQIIIQYKLMHYAESVLIDSASAVLRIRPTKMSFKPSDYSSATLPIFLVLDMLEPGRRNHLASSHPKKGGGLTYRGKCDGESSH